MRKSARLAGTTFAVLVVLATNSACSTGDDPTEPSQSPISVVGSVEVETHQPEPTVLPSPISDNPSADPSPPADSHDIFDEQLVDESALQALCDSVGSWWGSVGDVALADWKSAAAAGGYASTSTLDGYNDQTYAALAGEEWSDFEARALVPEAPGTGICLMLRPTTGSKSEAVIFTYQYVEPAVPGTMVHVASDTQTNIKTRALDALAR